MGTYIVELVGNHRAFVTVEAEDEQTAMELAEELADSGDVQEYDEFYDAESAKLDE